MNENTIITKAMKMATQDEVEKAYDLLVEKKKELKEIGALYYNNLSCFAALSNKKEEALSWLEEAINGKGIWYGPSLFDDTDYDTIREEERFKKCVQVSTQLYKEAKESAKSIFSWSEKKSDKLAIALHGNYQNNQDAKKQWKFLSEQKYQIEYLQSPTQEASGLCIWDIEKNGPKELKNAMKKCSADKYSEQILCGFSAGCGTILNAILTEGVDCTTIILQSPSIPIIENSPDDILKILKDRNVKILLICDTEDTGCFTLAKILYDAAVKNRINIKKKWTTGIGHKPPENLDEIVGNFLK